jgi:ribosomal protein L7Ae-like RNA K-turn-binding protein
MRLWKHKWKEAVWMDSIPPFLGLVFRAGRLAVGEEPVGAACRAHKAYLLLLASDAADNTIRRANHFTQAGNTLCLTLPHTKDELGSCLGRTSCAMVAVTDVGFAASLAEKLARLDPETYTEASQALAYKAARAKKRKAEARAHDKKSKRGGAWSPKQREKKKQ